MKRWIGRLASLSTVAGVIALALFLAGVFDGSEASGNRGSGAELPRVCVEGDPDCAGFATNDDGGGAVAPGCEVGHVGVCNDTPIADGETSDLFEGDGPALQPACAPGVPDCVDTIVNDANGDFDDAEPATAPAVPDDGEEQAVNVVLADAEDRFGVDESEIVVESAAFQVWSSTCLGAASEGEACGDAITPGFVIIIEVEGTRYEYHTDDNGGLRLAL